MCQLRVFNVSFFLIRLITFISYDLDSDIVTILNVSTELDLSETALTKGAADQESVAHYYAIWWEIHFCHGRSHGWRVHFFVLNHLISANFILGSELHHWGLAFVYLLLPLYYYS